MLLFSSSAQRDYSGPEDLRIFADILPYIGEVTVSFSRVERRVTWAIESLIGSTADEAHEMEDFVVNFSARLKFLELVGLPVSRETQTETQFSEIMKDLRKANTERNLTLHNAFTGIRGSLASGGLDNIAAVKSRYHKRLENRSYELPVTHLRAVTEKNLELCTRIQAWVMVARPNSQNRVP